MTEGEWERHPKEWACGAGDAGLVSDLGTGVTRKEGGVERRGKPLKWLCN